MRTGDLATSFIDAVLAEMVSTVFALTGFATSVAPSQTAGGAAPGRAWLVTISLAGTRKGVATVSLDAVGTETLARVVMGLDADVNPTTTTALIRELIDQAVSGLARQAAFAGVTISVGAIESAARPPGASVSTISFGDSGRLDVTATAVIEAVGPAASAAVAVPSSLPGPAAMPTGLATTHQGNWDVVLDIDLPLRVRFGATEMSIRSLSALGPGSIVDMGRAPDDPVEIVVCGRVIARAEVVVVDGNYGVRVVDLLSAAERVRALEGQL